jgi:hypothetical protein
MMLRYSFDCPFIIAGASHGANRNSRPSRIFRGLCRNGDHRDSRVWAARCCADHRFIFGYTPAFWSPPAFSSGRRPSITDFAGSARGAFFAEIAAALLGASPAEGADSDAILI